MLDEGITLEEFRAQIKQAAAHILSITKAGADIAVVLGTGLSSYADTAFKHGHVEIDYKDIPNLPITTVIGHKGKLYYGEIQGKRCVCFGGRFHSYEGHPPPTMTILPYLAKELGCKVYVLTNAAGGTIKGMQEGCLMSIVNHGFTACWNPLHGYDAITLKEPLDTLAAGSSINASADKLLAYLAENGRSNYQYPASISSNNIYSDQLVALTHEIASKEDFQDLTRFTLKGADRHVDMHAATYWMYSGPYYETRSEIFTPGISLLPGTVGMSSIPESLCARVLGMHVLGLSLVTDVGFDHEHEFLSHEAVQMVAKCCCKAVEELVSRILKGLDLDTLGFNTEQRVRDTAGKRVAELAIDDCIVHNAAVEAALPTFAGQDALNLNVKSRLIPTTEAQPTVAEVKAFKATIVGVDRLASVKYVLFVSSAVPFCKVIGAAHDCLLAGVVVTAGLHHVAMVYAVAASYGIETYFVVDRSMSAESKLVRAENCLNFTSMHCVNPLVPQPATLRRLVAARNSTKLAAVLADNASADQVMVVESIEEPRTNPYWAKTMREMKLRPENGTNKVNMHTILLGRSLGFSSVYMTTPEFLRTLLASPTVLSALDAVVPAKHATGAIPISLCPLKPRFAIFQDVAQPHPAVSRAFAEAIVGRSGGAFTTALLVDSPNARCFMTRFAKKHDLARVFLAPADVAVDGHAETVSNLLEGMHVYAKGSTLIMTVPSIVQYYSLTESCYPARICQALKIKATLAVTDQYCSSESKDICVSDLNNIAGISSLRGENFPENGTRFPGTIGICNRDLVKRLMDSGDYVSKEALLFCTPTDLLSHMEYYVNKGFVSVACGAFQSLFDFSHAEMTAGCLAGCLCSTVTRALEFLAKE